MASNRPSQDKRNEFTGAGILPFPPRQGSITWLRLALPLTVLLSACAVTDPLPQAAEDPVPLTTHHLTAPTLEHLERYGAAAAVHDHLAVVGAWGNSRHGHEAGAAYVYRFEEEASEWTLDGEPLFPEGAAPGRRFGHAVALEEDIVAVSAIYDDSSGYRAGAVHLFERGSDHNGSDEPDSEGWQERIKLLPPPGSDNAHFGSAIALHEDTLAVSSAGASAPRIDIYSRTEDGWQKTASLSAPAASVGQYFGGDLVLGENVLVVGASDRENSGPGSVYLFRLGDEGWQPAGSLQNAAGDPLFGSSLDLGPHGLLAVGAPNPVKGGTVYLYRLSEGDDHGFEALQEQVLRPEAGGQPHFGTALAIFGETVAVGSPGAEHEGVSSGLVHVYRNEEASGGWMLASEVTPSVPAEDLAFGITVAASDRFLTIGATGEVNGETISGSVEIVSLQAAPASVE